MDSIAFRRITKLKSLAIQKTHSLSDYNQQGFLRHYNEKQRKLKKQQNKWHWPKTWFAAPSTHHPRDSRSSHRYSVQVCLFWITNVCRIQGSFPKTCRPISFQIMLSSQSWTGLEGPKNTLILGAFNSLLYNSWRGKPKGQLTAVSEERDGEDPKN